MCAAVRALHYVGGAAEGAALKGIKREKNTISIYTRMRRKGNKMQNYIRVAYISGSFKVRQ